MIPYLHNAIFKVNNFLESLPSFWIMRSQRSRRGDKGLWGFVLEAFCPTRAVLSIYRMEGLRAVCIANLYFL